jgi:hypothetical protein
MQDKTLSKTQDEEVDEDSVLITGKETKEFVERLRNLPVGNELCSIEDKSNGIIIEFASKKFNALELGNLALQVHSNILNSRLNFTPRYIG